MKIPVNSRELAMEDTNETREQFVETPPRFGYGLDLDDQKFARFLTEVCAPFREFYTRWPIEPQQEGNDDFFLYNYWFESIDAEVLYCLVRHVKPKQIVEVGCGYSTRLMRRAITDGNLTTRLTCIDPEPRVEIQQYADAQLARPVEELEPSVLADILGANDILFIDSSHTVKAGGDVPFLYLEVVPRLRPGVLIHAHDIFVPFDYPKEWLEWGWNEQYVVNALLHDERGIEIVWPSHYMWRCHPDEVMKTIPCAYRSDSPPGSLWLRKLR